MGLLGQSFHGSWHLLANEASTITKKSDKRVKISGSASYADGSDMKSDTIVKG